MEIRVSGQGRTALSSIHDTADAPMGFTTVIDPETRQPVEVDFRRWLSITWSDIVAHPDLGERTPLGSGCDHGFVVTGGTDTFGGDVALEALT